MKFNAPPPTRAGECDPFEHLLQRIPDAGQAEDRRAPEARADDAALAAGGRHEGVLGLLPAEGIQSDRLQLLKVNAAAGLNSNHWE